MIFYHDALKVSFLGYLSRCIYHHTTSSIPYIYTIMPAVYNYNITQSSFYREAKKRLLYNNVKTSIYIPTIKSLDNPSHLRFSE